MEKIDMDYKQQIGPENLGPTFKHTQTVTKFRWTHTITSSFPGPLRKPG